jgi:sirohydrochlorin ferrochelatase
LKSQGLGSRENKPLIAAHGGQTSKGNPKACHTLKATLATRLNFREIRLGFLEHPPLLQDISSHLVQAICLSYVVQRTGHVLDDLSESFTRRVFDDVILPP